MKHYDDTDMVFQDARDDARRDAQEEGRRDPAPPEVPMPVFEGPDPWADEIAALRARQR